YIDPRYSSDAKLGSAISFGFVTFLPNADTIGYPSRTHCPSDAKPTVNGGAPPRSSTSLFVVLYNPVTLHSTLSRDTGTPVTLNSTPLVLIFPTFLMEGIRKPSDGGVATRNSASLVVLL